MVISQASHEIEQGPCLEVNPSHTQPPRMLYVADDKRSESMTSLPRAPTRRGRGEFRYTDSDEDIGSGLISGQDFVTNRVTMNNLPEGVSNDYHERETAILRDESPERPNSADIRVIRGRSLQRRFSGNSAISASSQSPGETRKGPATQPKICGQVRHLAQNPLPVLPDRAENINTRSVSMTRQGYTLLVYERPPMVMTAPVMQPSMARNQPNSHLQPGYLNVPSVVFNQQQQGLPLVQAHQSTLMRSGGYSHAPQFQQPHQQHAAVRGAMMQNLARSFVQPPNAMIHRPSSHGYMNAASAHFHQQPPLLNSFATVGQHIPSQPYPIHQQHSLLGLRNFGVQQVEGVYSTSPPVNRRPLSIEQYTGVPLILNHQNQQGMFNTGPARNSSDPRVLTQPPATVTYPRWSDGYESAPRTHAFQQQGQAVFNASSDQNNVEVPTAVYPTWSDGTGTAPQTNGFQPQQQGFSIRNQIAPSLFSRPPPARMQPLWSVGGIRGYQPNQHGFANTQSVQPIYNLSNQIGQHSAMHSGLINPLAAGYQLTGAMNFSELDQALNHANLIGGRQFVGNPITLPRHYRDNTPEY